MRIKTISFLVALIAGGAIWTGGAFASGPTTTCPPANFKCALSVAQTKSLSDPTNPGRPGVVIGYLVFDNSATPIPTIFVEENKDGVLKALGTTTGTCASGASGAPGTLDFTSNGGPLLRFVVFHGGAELRVIDGGTGTGVTLGSCRQL